MLSGSTTSALVSMPSTINRASCEQFLAIWKKADPDIQIYRQAKVEYANLKAGLSAGKRVTGNLQAK
jgi:hypothetical protein